LTITAAKWASARDPAVLVVQETAITSATSVRFRHSQHLASTTAIRGPC
jgi:hypothetical protein